MGWGKILLPIILDYFKEILLPHKDAKKTTLLERVLSLLVIIMFVMLSITGERFFSLYDRMQVLNREAAIAKIKYDVAHRKYLEMVEDYNGLRAKYRSLQDKRCEVEAPTYDDEEGEHQSNEDGLKSLRSEIINHINS